MKNVIAWGVAGLLAISLSACGGGSSYELPPPEMNNGWTKIQGPSNYGSVLKRCDGPNLIYRLGDSRGGLDVIENAAECTGASPAAPTR